MVERRCGYVRQQTASRTIESLICTKRARGNRECDRQRPLMDKHVKKRLKVDAQMPVHKKYF